MQNSCQPLTTFTKLFNNAGLDLVICYLAAADGRFPRVTLQAPPGSSAVAFPAGVSCPSLHHETNQQIAPHPLTPSSVVSDYATLHIKCLAVHTIPHPIYKHFIPYKITGFLKSMPVIVRIIFFYSVIIYYIVLNGTYLKA